MNTEKYLFKSSRLGFRNWENRDLVRLSEINRDRDVMRFFPKIYTPEETASFIQRMQKQLTARGYCYFAVDLIQDQKFIGFIGLSYQEYEASFTPCVDIGWRLSKQSWNRGFATEGARACLTYGFNILGLSEIYSVAPEVNLASIRVMEKIGMTLDKKLNHPLLKDHPILEKCVLYKITNPA